MADAQLETVLRRLRVLVCDRHAALTDGQLLEAFALRADEEAFAALLRRHGTMVLGVCRRLLRHEQDREDAFQATFLLLARQARSIRKRDSVGSWLHRVVHRVAMKLRRKTAGPSPSSLVDPCDCRPGPDHEAATRELQATLDDALAGLPEIYRAALLLCYFEGRTVEEAGRELGCPTGTVASRLFQGRKLLRQRLARRGQVLSVGALTTFLLGGTARAMLPPVLTTTTLRIGLQAAGGKTAALSASVARLVAGMPGDVPWTSWKAVAVLLLAGVTVWVGAMFHQPAAAEQGAGEQQGGLQAAAGDGKQPTAIEEPPTAPDVTGDPLPRGAVVRLGTSRLKHARVTSGLAFTPDDRLLITASHMDTLRFWDVTNGKETRVLRGAGNKIALSPDGKVLACSSWNGRITLLDTATGRLMAAFNGHTSEVVSLAFSTDSTKLLSGSRDRTVRLWDAKKGLQLWSSTAAGEVRCVALSRDGKRAAGACADKRVYLWNAENGDAQRTLEGHGTQVTAVAFTPDNKSVASCSWDGTARVWDVATAKQTRIYKGLGGAEGIAVSPDGKTLAVVAGWAHTLHVWDVTAKDEKLLWKGRQPHGVRVAFSRHGKLLASVGWDNTVRLWDAKTGRRLPAGLPAGHEGWVYGAVALPDGKGVIAADSGGEVLLWDHERRRVVRRFDGHTGRVWCLACSPDGKTLATGSSDQTIRIWDVLSGRELRKIPVSGHVKGLAFSPDGKRLASAVGDDRLSSWLAPTPGAAAEVWETATGARKLTLAGHEGGVKAVAFAPDGLMLVTAGNDGTVRLWEAATGKERRRLTVGKGAVEAVAFSPDGELIAATGEDRKVWLWRARSGEKVFDVQGPNGWGLSLAFAPDGRTLVSAAVEDTIYDGSGAQVSGNPIRLWEVATGKERDRFEGHQGTAHATAFATDETKLITGGADGSVLFWDLTGLRGGARQRAPQAAWGDLLGNDAVAAGQAIRSLVAQPKAALPLLRAALKPIPRASQTRIAKLIKDLDDDDFQARLDAWKELEAIGEPAAPALREVLKASSVEVRTRAELLLKNMSAQQLTGDRLRLWRALEVLEHIHNPEATALLKALANGAPEAERTRQAKAALARRAARRRS